MAEARNDGDEEFPNVSITRRRGSTGRTIITVTITSVTDLRFCSFTSQDCYVLRLFEILAWFTRQQTKISQIHLPLLLKIVHFINQRLSI